MRKPDIHRLIELQSLMLKFNSIERSIRYPGNFKRHETDTEHSFSLVMATWFLAQYFPKINTDKAIRLSLTHDLVEIHAGDTFAYSDKSVIDSKPKREALAVKKLSQEWSDFPEVIASINEYEAYKSEEAKFVYALDKLMPVLVNFLGKGEGWQKYGITFDKLVAEKEAKIRNSPEIYDYYQQLIEILQKHPEFFSAG